MARGFEGTERVFPTITWASACIVSLCVRGREGDSSSLSLLLVNLHLFFAPLCQECKESEGMMKRCATQITVNLLCFNVSEGAFCIDEPAEFCLRFQQTKELVNSCSVNDYVSFAGGTLLPWSVPSVFDHLP